MSAFGYLVRVCVLFCLISTSLALAEALPNRAYAKDFPVSMALPEGWESFSGDPEVKGEVLFLQSPKSSPLNSFVRLSAYPLPKTWDALLRRETFQLVVEMDAPVLTNEALTLRGAKGHKWVYQAVSSSGQNQIHYRLYLALPSSVGANRLLVLDASAPLDQKDQALLVFGELARSLAWGQDAAP